jgi:enolase
VIDQMMIDLDGTPNKSKLGANAILGVSACKSSQHELGCRYTDMESFSHYLFYDEYH